MARLIHLAQRPAKNANIKEANASKEASQPGGTPIRIGGKKRRRLRAFRQYKRRTDATVGTG